MYVCGCTFELQWHLHIFSNKSRITICKYISIHACSQLIEETASAAADSIYSMYASMCVCVCTGTCNVYVECLCVMLLFPTHCRSLIVVVS